MKSKSYIFVLVVLGMGLISGFLYWRSAYKLGLDVRGGLRFTYQIEPVAPKPGQPPETMDEMRSKVQEILETRIASVTGVAEGTVTLSGADQVVVEIPGYADEDKAREQIGTSASLKCYWAKNVRQGPPHTSERQYESASDTRLDDQGHPIVYFTDTFHDNKVLKPGDPAYAEMISGWQLLASGGDLVSATVQHVGENAYQPNITFTSQAGDVLRDWSLQHKNTGEQIAFVLDDRVLQIAPVVEGGTLGSEITVQGQFPADYVTSLTSMLNAGALPADLKLLGDEKVDPTIGANALSKMVSAGLVAFGVISLFLVIYYAFPGVVALVALGLYVLFTLTVLKEMGATFSLAAIAGFVLSVGMAVDANILVFERFKEEIKKGKPLHDALKLGFSRALPAIVDSNACSILTSLVLVSIGTGPVKGFATTLIIGVVISLFTAVTVTRSLLFFLTDSGVCNDPKFYGLNRNWFGERLENEASTRPLQIVNNARKWFTITACVVVAGLVCIGMGGLKPGVEFTGGIQQSYARTPGFPTSPQIQASLEKAGYKGASVEFGSSGKGDVAYIKVLPPKSALNETEQEQAITVAAGLPADTPVLTHNFVGPVIQQQTINNAIGGIIAAFALIVVYLGFRFGLALGSFGNGLRFGISAILAGAKDIVVILGVAAAVGLIFHWDITSLFLTAMLTVIGFSVHDKIVIFDRVRENLRRPVTGESFENLMNRSVTQSFARSINTAATVCVTLAILIAFGTPTPELKFFCVAMFAGIAWGTYSSIYTAAPVLSVWESWIARHRGEQATLLAVSLADAARRRIIRPAGAPAPTPQPANGEAAQPQRSYGQVRRRANAVQQSHRELDDDDDL